MELDVDHVIVRAVDWNWSDVDNVHCNWKLTMLFWTESIPVILLTGTSMALIRDVLRVQMGKWIEYWDFEDLQM